MAANDDGLAFEAGYAELFTAARRVARKIVSNDASADDIAAEATARALARWSKVAPHALPWVIRVATNLSIDTLRRRRPTSALAERSLPETDAAANLDLREALSGLPRRQRQVLALRYLAGYDEAAVARVLDVSPNTVKTHTRRGLERLRHQLGDRAPEEQPA